MEIDDLLNDIESKFNIVGSIPLISAFSGCLRSLAGQVQFVAGAILAVVGTVQKNRDGQELCHLGYKHLVHGLANAGRGAIEGFLGATFFGSFLFLGAQLLSERQFAPILDYDDPDPIASIKGMFQSTQSRFGL